MSAALIVFAKAPVAGRVKTRLSPPLAPDEAARLYAAFLADALDAFVAPGALGVEPGPAVRLYLAPSDTALPPGLVPVGVTVHAQRGTGLGARMLHAFTETLAAGPRRAVIVGTDHPTLPLAYLGRAFDALAEPDTVALGPSDDGGYYALGLTRPLPALFDMTYSHPAVFEATRARAARAGARPVVLPPWYDVDDAPALARLIAEWRGGAAVGPRTAAVLARLLEAHPYLPDPAASG